LGLIRRYCKISVDDSLDQPTMLRARTAANRAEPRGAIQVIVERPPMLTAMLMTSAITALTILIHYEALRLTQWWHDYPMGGRRIKVVSGVFLLFTAHALEIWLFALAIFVSKNMLLLGDLNGTFTETWRDYLYFSVVTYAAVGYGDVLPTGFIRTICGFEALTGIMMMAWSAAFTVFRLQDMWQNDGSGRT